MSDYEDGYGWSYGADNGVLVAELTHPAVGPHTTIEFSLDELREVVFNGALIAASCE